MTLCGVKSSARLILNPERWKQWDFFVFGRKGYPVKVFVLMHSSVTSCFHLICGLLCSAMRETKEALENASVGLEVLKEGTGKLNFNLSLVRTSINRTLNDPGCHDEESDATSAQLCRNIRQSLSQLQISANFTRVQVLKAEIIEYWSKIS